MKNKRGLSEVVTTVIMIALVMAAAAIIWGVVSSLINEQTVNTQSCFGKQYDKVTIYGAKTCMVDATTLSVYINVKDVNVSKLILTYTTEAEGKSFEIPGNNPNVAIYTAATPSWGAELSPISPNSGKRYLIKGLDSKPSLITLSTFVGGSDCGVADTLNTVEFCS